MKIIRHNKFFQVKEKWKELYEGNGNLSPYQSAEYAEIAYSHYAPYAVKLKVIPVIFEIIEDDKTIMIAPLCKKALKDEYIMFGDRSGYGYLDFIYSGSIGDEKIGECIEFLGNELKGFKLSISRLRGDSLTCQYLLKKHEAKEVVDCVHIDLTGSYDEYFASLKKNVRHHVRTAYNRLENEQKTVCLKMFSGKPLPDEELSGIIDIYVARRQSRYKINEGTIMKKFLKNYDIGSVAMKKMDNYVHFILCIDGKAVAFCNGALSKDSKTLFMIRLAIDSDYAKYSPGILLLNESIKKVFEFNIAGRIDLIQGGQRYKYEMGGETHNCFDFDIVF